MRRPREVTALFAGVGGLELGLSQSGHRTALFCEVDPEASSVLRARFPGVPVVPDIRQPDEVIRGTSGNSNLLTAGFPCTDFSQAGRVAGKQGRASSLVGLVFQLLRKREFPELLFENVPNWRMLHGGSYLKEILTNLEKLGYRWAYRTVDARAFGLPQRRLRIFLYATKIGDPRSALFHGNHPELTSKTQLHERAHGFYWTEGNRGLGWGDDCVPTLKGGSRLGVPSPPAIVLKSGRVVTPDIRDAERLQGFPAEWTDAGPLRWDGECFNQRRRWLLVGNAINVRVAAWIGSQLRTMLPYTEQLGPLLDDDDKLPTCAWFDGEVRRREALSAWPVLEEQEPLEEFLRYPPHDLSIRATAGFYERILKSGLRLSAGFPEALKAHLDRMTALSLNARGEFKKSA